MPLIKPLVNIIVLKTLRQMFSSLCALVKQKVNMLQ